MTSREIAITPVLLLPGWNARARVMRRLERFLRRNGWPADAVEKLEFRNIWGSNIEHAAEIEVAIDRLLDRTGSESLDVVAHSMGGLAARWYMAAHPRPPVRRAVFVGTPHRGTYLAWTAWGHGGREMRPGSQFLKRLDEVGSPGHVRLHTIRTELETRIMPARNAKLDGAIDHCVGYATTHRGLLRSSTVFRLVADCLSDERNQG